jgi:hypothetical protein
MIIHDDKSFKLYTEYLLRLYPKNLRATVASYLFKVAYETREESIKNLRNNFILRNRYTEKGVLYHVQTRADSLNNMYAEVGAVGGPTKSGGRGYLARQEIGGYVPRGGEGVPIAQRAARVGKSKEKRVTTSKRLRNMSDTLRFSAYRGYFKSRKAALVAMAIAAKKKNKPLEMPWKDGVFEIRGKINISRKGKVKFKNNFLYSYESNVRTPKREWLQPATDTTMKKADRLFLEAAKKKMKDVTFKY